MHSRSTTLDAYIGMLWYAHIHNNIYPGTTCIVSEPCLNNYKGELHCPVHVLTVLRS